MTAHRGTWVALLVVTLLVGSIGMGTAPAAPVAPAVPAATGPDPFGPVEKKRITVGIRLPNLGSQAPIYIGLDKGFYREEGFDEVKVVITQQVREGVAGGSLDFGVAELGPTVEAVTRNVPLKIIAAWRNYERHYIAARREIASARDLDGKPVLLGGVAGDPSLLFRQTLLREVGWDLTAIRPNYVVVPGGSDTWVRLFLEGRLVMTYFFPRHVQSIEQGGHRILVRKRIEAPNDMIIADTGLLSKNPNTTGRFLRATLRAMAILKDNSTRDYVLGVMEKNGFRVTDIDRSTYEEGTSDQYDADMALLQEPVARLLKQEGFNDPPKFEAYTNFFYLRRAWRSLGIKPRP